MNGINPLLVYADNVNVLSETLSATEKTVKSIVAGKDVRLDVVTGITKHIFMFNQKRR